MKRMLLVFAHPDDESFTCGVTIPAAVKEGWEVNLVCATRGEVGKQGTYADMTDKLVGNIRSLELKEAARVLGISSVVFLGYKDGRLPSVPHGELEDILYKKMVEDAPEIVITFDPTGISNHPDHIKLSHATTFAFQKYAKHLAAARQLQLDVQAKKTGLRVRNFLIKHKHALRQEPFVEMAETSVEPRLYFVCIPESMVQFLKKQNVIPVESFGKPWVGTPDHMISAVIRGKDQVETKLKALACHKTQRPDVERFYSYEENPLAYTEFFYLRMQGTKESFMGKTDLVADHL